MFYWIIKILFGPIIKLVWIKDVEGLGNIPDYGPVIIAANHSSYFDFLTLAAACPRRIRFLAAEIFYKSWFWKPVMILTGQIRVNRSSDDKSSTINSADSVLSSGNVLGIFPEGTRTRTGKMQKGYMGVARFAKNNGAPIIPLAIIGSYEVMSPHDKFPKFRKKIKLIFLEPISNDVINSNCEEDIVHGILMPRISSALGQNYEFR